MSSLKGPLSSTSQLHVCPESAASFIQVRRLSGVVLPIFFSSSFRSREESLSSPSAIRPNCVAYISSKSPESVRKDAHFVMSDQQIKPAHTGLSCSALYSQTVHSKRDRVNGTITKRTVRREKAGSTNERFICPTGFIHTGAVCLVCGREHDAGKQRHALCVDFKQWGW